MQQTAITKLEIKRLNKQFLQSSDFTAKEIDWGPDEKAILCFYSSLVKKSEVEHYIFLLRPDQKTPSQSGSNTEQNKSEVQKDEQTESNSKTNSPNENKSGSESSAKESESGSESSARESESGSESSTKESESGTESSTKESESGSESSTKESESGSESSAKESESGSESSAKENKSGSESSQKENKSGSESSTKESESGSESSAKESESGSESSAKENKSASESSQKENKSGSESSAKENESGSESSSKQAESVTITTETYNDKKLVEYICNGETIIILPKNNEMIRLNSPDFVHRTPDEPDNEQVLRGSHEGLIENFDANISLIRKRIKNNKLIVKQITLGKETNTLAYYVYLNDVVDKGALKALEGRLQKINIKMFYSVGQLSDYLDDRVWSPFPQLLNTERPDRVVASILEGKIAVLTDVSPTALIGPVTFFTFYQSPDDFNARVLVGTFYRIVRILSFLSAIFLPALYISIVSFHFEVLPLELANKVKTDINQIPYRPLIEALIMEITIELIREASVRLPKSIGQTIGIVGGLVIGQSIVSAGLVSNLMVIVVAFTAISSFVVPSVELNTSIRMLRFPFMLIASLFGFFGMVIGTFVLVIHLLNLSSLTRPYFSPIIPFQPKEIRKIFFREPYYKANKQATSFSPQKDDKT